MIADADLDRARAVAAAVPDPEIPAVSVGDLGILRRVRHEDGVVVAELSPTYSGCPAVVAIELAVGAALAEAGFEARIGQAVLRMDRGAPIHGLVVHAVKRFGTGEAGACERGLSALA